MRKFNFALLPIFGLLSMVVALPVMGASKHDAPLSVRQEVMTNPAKAGGIYYAYPGEADSLAAAPEGYTPFYISHYGRHGSRYLIDDKDYSRLINHFAKADSLGQLTPTGQEVLRRLNNVWKEAEGRGGELTPLGAAQHKGIARRMFESYPEVFADGAELTARSTRVMRCAHSMMAFCEGLKELNPNLVIPKESSQRWMDYLCWWTPEAGEWNSDRGPWKPIYDNFRADNINPDRFISSLFTSTDSLPLADEDLYTGMYWLAVDMQNMDTNEDFFGFFLPNELYSLWRVFNLSFYMTNSSYPLSEGLIISNGRNLLENIIVSADDYIARDSRGATLRFGHDGNITPLAALMQLNGFCGEELDPAKVEEAWQSFNVAPMAANLQVIFFRNDADPSQIIVKFMMSEHDVLLPIESSVGAPFYTWEEAREFLDGRVKAATAILDKSRQKK